MILRKSPTYLYHSTLDDIDALEEAIEDDAELDWATQNYAFENQLSRRGFSGPRLLQLARHRRDGLAALDVIDCRDLMDRQGVPKMLIGAMIPQGVAMGIGANGGVGKTTLFYNFARHIALGEPWSGYSVNQGRVLIVQCDEPEQDINRKLRSAKFSDVPRGMIHFIRTWRFTQFRQLERYIKQEGFNFVVIDSWTSVHAGMGLDLSRSNAGDNMYLLRNLAGETGATFAVLHHLNRMGGYRDSSTFEDNPSEVWKLTRGTRQEGFLPNERLLEITKSRAGLAGKYKLAQVPHDYSWTHEGPWATPDSPELPGMMLRIQDHFVRHPDTPFGPRDIAQTFEIDYEKAETELKRLENLGIIKGTWITWSRPGHESQGFWSYRLSGASDTEEQPINPQHPSWHFMQLVV